MKHRMLVMAMCLHVATAVFSIVPLQEPQLGGNPTGIAPLFFGPNAFPVPDMLDGRTQDKLKLELAGDAYFGNNNAANTVDVFARVFIPLFTERVNLTLWMPVMEWYKDGHEAGDAYVSTDIHVLRQKRICPDIAIRAAVKSASGGGFAKARYYDCPGYFFDGAIGKSIYIGRGKVKGIADDDLPLEIRLSGSAGFLCWQTDNGRQNDAVMYGLQLLLQHTYISLRTTWGGYVGWEDYGDRPMTIKVKMSGHIKGFEPYFQYQYGIKDYPFQQFRIGLAYNIDILRHPQAPSVRGM